MEVPLEGEEVRRLPGDEVSLGHLLANNHREAEEPLQANLLDGEELHLVNKGVEEPLLVSQEAVEVQAASQLQHEEVSSLREVVVSPLLPAVEVSRARLDLQDEEVNKRS